MGTFDYSQIPEGFYDEVLRTGHPIRRAWHLQKFQRVIEALPFHDEAGDTSKDEPKKPRALLDIGCFAGSFLSMVPRERFGRQLGVDILPEQIKWAEAHYGTPWRRFKAVQSIDSIEESFGTFDCITLIEVLEHLSPQEIRLMLQKSAQLLCPGGRLIITTPNYTSSWPLLEWILNRSSDVSYEEQHITKFHWWNLTRKLAAIDPQFTSSFAVDFQTSTHFVAPFLAVFSLEGANAVARRIDPRRWRHPFGSLLLLSLSRR